MASKKKKKHPSKQKHTVQGNRQKHNARRLYQAEDLLNQGNINKAEEQVREIIAATPDFAEAHFLAGNIARAREKHQEAASYYNRALELRPEYARAWHNLGTAYRDLGQLDRALECYEKARTLAPEIAEVYNNEGITYLKMNRADEAARLFRRSLDIKPDFPDPCNNLGYLYQRMGMLSEAAAWLQKALEINPELAGIYNNLGNIYRDQGKFREAITTYRQAVAKMPDFAVAHSNIPFCFNYDPEADQETIYRESLNWWQQQGKPVAGQFSHKNDTTENRRLKIGYISPDFCLHSVSYFFLPLLQKHDRKQVGIFCYSDVVTPDDMTIRLQQASDHWRSIVGLSDRDVAELIDKDGIDILVDLTGHTANNRLLVFSRKPAPVQVSWLGYPNTTGLATMDYRLTDGIADPEGRDDRYYSEELVRLPGPFLCYSPLPDAPPVGELPAKNNGVITFGSFNNLTKTNNEVLKVWAGILKNVPDSRLLLKSGVFADPPTCENYLSIFENQGITRERIELLKRTASPYDHLDLYNRIDIGLDPFPYNGTTTTFEAMHMGVPIITLKGEHHAGRVGTTIMQHIGLEECVAGAREDYITRAVQMAGDLRLLGELRGTLRRRLADSVLSDGRNFAFKMEAAFREMWRRWCRRTNKDSPREEAATISSSLQHNLEKEKESKVARAQHYNVKGEELFNAGQLQEARLFFQQAVETDPDCATAYNNLGVLSYHQNKLQEALGFFRKSLEINRDDLTTLDNINEVLTSLNQGKTQTQPVKQPVSILHHMARSGGTLIAKCLGCMDNIVLLSEIHPHGGKWFNPILQAYDWFKLFTRHEAEKLLQNPNPDFSEIIGLILERCNEKGKYLVIRDWSHLDFTGHPFSIQPSYELTTANSLTEDFDVNNYATVRHPIDQWLSCNTKVLQDRMPLAHYLKGYREFAEHCRELGFIRYEDFIREPERELQVLCQHLNIPYDASFSDKWWQYTTITGENPEKTRGARKEIKPVSRPPLSREFLEAFAANEDYRTALEILGYDHPAPLPSRGRKKEKAAELPTVIASSVIRSAHQGQSHGGVYIINLENENFEQVIDWNDQSINWEGRGMDRGLRGIAFYQGYIYLAASDEIFVYDQHFRITESFRNPYMRHVHEIWISGNSLYITSTGFDSILIFDLITKAFIKGYTVRLDEGGEKISFNVFDPNTQQGPAPGDSLHLNSVSMADGILFFAGLHTTVLLSIRNDELNRYALIPTGSHNAQVYKNGLIVSNTRQQQINIIDLNGRIRESFAIPVYSESRLLNTDLPEDHARQGFARGLCYRDDGLIIAGSSPATISVYKEGKGASPLKSLNLSMDIRNAIHGLEIWPY